MRPALGAMPAMIESRPSHELASSYLEGLVGPSAGRHCRCELGVGLRASGAHRAGTGKRLRARMGVPHTGPGIRSRVCEEDAEFAVIARRSRSTGNTDADVALS